MKTLSIAKKDLTTTFETIVLAMVKVPGGKLPKSSWANATDLDVTETGRLIFSKRSVNHIVTDNLKMKVVITSGFIDIEIEGDIELAANKLGLEKDSLEKLLSVEIAEAQVEEMKEVEQEKVEEVKVNEVVGVVTSTDTKVIQVMSAILPELQYQSKSEYYLNEGESFEQTAERILAHEPCNKDSLSILVYVFDETNTMVHYQHAGLAGAVLISADKYSAYLPKDMTGAIPAAMSADGFILDEGSAERLAISLKEAEVAPETEEQPEPVLEECGYKSLSTEKTRAIMDKAAKKRTTPIGRFMRRNMGRIFG